MSGTSLDGLDIAVADFQQVRDEIDYELVLFRTMPYSLELRVALLELMDPAAPLQRVSSMNMYLGELYARLIREALVDSKIDYSSIDLISSHGQTLWHEPEPLEQHRFARANTLQIGDISALAGFSGKPVIGDFRTRDIAAGGQGAPLVPLADQTLFQSESEGRVLLNIGGIANMTVIPTAGSERETLAYDTGPGNMIIDAFTSIHTEGRLAYDEGGQFAKAGKVSEGWLDQLLSHPYFQLSAPKSTGRELFGEVQAQLLWKQGDGYGLSAEDKIATVTMMAAVTIADEVNKFGESHELKNVFVSGGGVHNETLIDFLRGLLPGMSLRQTAEIGIEGDAKEAFVFALLGYLGFHQQPNNLPAATGADNTAVLGKIAWP